MNKKNQIKFYRTFQFMLGIIFLFLSGCKTKFIESESVNNNDTTLNKKSSMKIDTTTMNIIQPEYGVIINTYQPIEKEPETPFYDE